jgi:hypothetical protein
MPMRARLFATCDEYEPGILTPVDPLTRLMMDADNVSVSEMEALMRRISRSLEKRMARHGEVTK